MIDHGTPRGYGQHRRQGEQACTACCDARAEYQRGRRAAEALGREAGVASRPAGVQTVEVEIPKAIVLSSNKQLHWAPEADHKATLRLLGKLNARGMKPMAAANLTVTLHFPDRHLRDAHNYMPTLKPLIDGMVDGRLLPDDSTAYLTGPDPRIDTDHLCPRGLVVATFTYTEREEL